MRKKSWFSFTRAGGGDPAPLGGASSSTTGRSERAPLFGGLRSDEGGWGGGLLASLVRNK